jgi:predicted transposase/invertase (TIGR01784 family)
LLYNGRDKWTACRSFKETLAEAELFKEFVVDFKYILIDVNRYDKKTLMDLANLIGTVFLIDQSKDFKDYMNRLLEIGPILRKFDTKSFQLFASWLKMILSVKLPDEAKQKIIKILDESKPEEAEKMVTNIEKIIENLYEEGLMAGKIEVAKNLLGKSITEDLVSETTGLPIEQIRKIKSELH